NDTAYTITALGLVKDNSFWKASATESVTSVALTDLVNANNWTGIVSVTSAGILNIPPSDTSAGEWIVIDSDNRYGLLTKTGENYSLSTTGSTATLPASDTINVTATTVTLSSGFTSKSITGENSGAAFTADSLSGDVFTVTDATAGANVTGAKKINQTAGTIALSTANQSIVAGSHSITGAAGKTITTYVSGANVTVGALDIGDSFTVDNDKTYTLLSNGRLQRSDNLVWSGATIASSIALNSLSASTWNGLIETDSNGNFSITSSAVAVFDNDIPSSAAYVVNQDDLTTIYGTLTKSGDDYTLSTTGKTGDNLSSVTVDLSKVIFTRDFLNTSIHAGETDFMATAAPSSKGFTVNYDSDSNEVSVGTATAVSLLSGALAISDSTTQTVTANAKTFQAASGSFTVNYDKDSDLASVSGIDTTSESVKVNGTTYTLLNGDGFGIEAEGIDISDTTKTTVTGLNTNDKFRIADSTGSYFEFTYTEAGLVRTKQNSSTISYILSTLNPTNNQLTLANLMSTDNDGTWLGLVEVSSDEVITLDGNLTNSAFLVDSIDTPTKNYGQITYDSAAKTYTLSKFTATGTIAEGTPTLISVGSGVTATIEGDFSNIPLTANNATEIIVNIVNGTSYKISGTIDRVDLQNKTFTPAVGDSFTVGDTAYLMTGAGLTKTADNEIWTEDISPQSYVLPTETSGTWSNIVKLTKAGVLDLSSVTVEAGNNVVVTSDSSARRATINYANSLYELSSTDAENLIATVKLADETPIDIDFATTVQTGSGTYTVNDKAYTTTSSITIDATATDSTLNTGTVTLDKDKAAVTATTSQTAISVTNDDVSITATATNGVWTSLGSLEDGDTFTIGSTKYKVLAQPLPS
ncbi:MAG: hypothetical protein IJG24_06170, partial [Selenomonadaceae bacterium]|nr:hypothetical protein [Selenomonadaceae bacterium]